MKKKTQRDDAVGNDDDDDDALFSFPLQSNLHKCQWHPVKSTQTDSDR